VTDVIAILVVCLLFLALAGLVELCRVVRS
jgi:hypothetical protein